MPAIVETGASASLRRASVDGRYEVVSGAAICAPIQVAEVDEVRPGFGTMRWKIGRPVRFTNGSRLVLERGAAYAWMVVAAPLILQTGEHSGPYMSDGLLPTGLRFDQRFTQLRREAAALWTRAFREQPSRAQGDLRAACAGPGLEWGLASLECGLRLRSSKATKGQLKATLDGRHPHVPCWSVHAVQWLRASRAATIIRRSLPVQTRALVCAAHLARSRRDVHALLPDACSHEQLVEAVSHLSMVPANELGFPPLLEILKMLAHGLAVPTSIPVPIGIPQEAALLALKGPLFGHLFEDVREHLP